MKTKILQIIFISILITTGGFACLFSPAVQGEMNPAKENSLTSLIAGLIGLTRSSNTTSSGNANTNTTGISTGTSTGNGTTATTGTSTGNGSTTTTGTGTTTVSAPSSLVYTGSPFTFTNGATIATQTPTITGTITNCAVTPSLPTGLTLNSTTCAISGTPTVNQAATSYTITASNSSGNTTGNVSITVNMAAPSNLVYSGSPFTFTNGSAIVTQTPTVTGTVTGCVASPSMPTGLILNATTCAISGTPTVNQGANSYTITASNAFGNTTKSISITINMAAPSNLVYSGSPFTFTNGYVIATQTPTVTGTVTGCVATPSLPPGLILNTTTCAISGTPTTNQGATAYTIMANNSGGNTTTSISIAVSADMVAPTTPSSFNAITISSAQINLSWIASTDDVTPQASLVYEICRTTINAGCGIFSVTYTTAASDTSYSVTGLSGSTTYYFVIRAKDLSGNRSIQSGQTIATTTVRYIGPTQNITYTGDYTTKDNLTNLIWKSCSEGQSGSNCSTGLAVMMDWPTSVAACTSLNSVHGAGAGYANRTTWRLATIGEFQGIVETQYVPIINPDAFPNTIADGYTSATGFGGTGCSGFTCAYYLGFEGFGAFIHSKTEWGGYVRCVSTGP